MPVPLVQWSNYCRKPEEAKDANRWLAKFPRFTRVLGYFESTPHPVRVDKQSKGPILTFTDSTVTGWGVESSRCTFFRLNQ